MPNLRDRDAWEAWTKFLARPWFHRAWIHQECALAREVVALVGKEIHRFDKLPEAVYRAGEIGIAQVRIGPYAAEAFRGYECLRNLGCLGSVVIDEESISLRNVLASDCGSHSSDPRDKVYALLGMFSDFHAHDLFPEYSLWTGILFMKVAQLLVPRGDALPL